MIICNHNDRPVVGIKGKTAASLQFQWKSFRTAYSCVMFVLMVIYAGMTLWITLSNKIQFDQISETIAKFCT